MGPCAVINRQENKSWQSGNLFALQYFRRITPRRLHRLRSDHKEGDRQYGQQTNKQLGDMHGGVIRKIGEHKIFKEKVGYGQGNKRRYRQANKKPRLNK